MQAQLENVRIGLALAFLILLLGIVMGVSFGLYEDAYQAYIAAGIAQHPALHDAISQNAIWRWALRAHFHAAGVGAFTLVLIVLTALSGASAARQRITSTLIGIGACYPLAWLAMFALAPAIGRKAAHQHWLPELIVTISVGALLLGAAALLHSLFRDAPGRRAGTLRRA